MVSDAIVQIITIQLMISMNYTMFVEDYKHSTVRRYHEPIKCTMKVLNDRQVIIATASY